MTFKEHTQTAYDPIATSTSSPSSSSSNDLNSSIPFELATPSNFTNTSHQHAYILNLYLFSLFTVGLSIDALRHVWLKKPTLANPFLILPTVALLTGLGFVFLDINRYFDNNPTDQLTMGTAQYILDWFSTVSMDLAYYLRLRIILQAHRQFSPHGQLCFYLSHLFLLIPCSWIIVTTVGMLSTYSPDYTHLSKYIFAIWNVGLSLNELLMHLFFVYFIIAKLKTVKSSDVSLLVLIALLASVNSLFLLSGAILSIFDLQLGITLIYSSWIVNVWVFLEINKAVSIVISSKNGKPVRDGGGGGAGGGGGGGGRESVGLVAVGDKIPKKPPTTVKTA